MAHSDRHRATFTRGPARTSMTVAAWTLVSRATGLLRYVVIGAVLGPTYLANTFVSSNNVPTIVYAAAAGPLIAMVVIPAVVGSVTSHGLGRSIELLRNISGFLLTGASALTLILILLSPVLAWTLTFGIADIASRSRATELTVLMVVCVAPQVVLYALAGLGAAAQQARGRFAVAAAAPALENVGLVATMTIVAVAYRPGHDVGDVPVTMVLALGLGATVSVAMHAALQTVGAHRAGVSIRPSLHWRSDPLAVQVARRARKSVAVVALPSAGFYVLSATAATVPGGVLVLQFAYSIYALMPGLGAQAVSTVVLPELSAAAHSRDLPTFAASWRRALTYVVIISMPAALLLAVFAEPIADVLVNGQLRSGPLVMSLAACTAIMGVAQLFNGIQIVGREALFARTEINGPRMASTFAFLSVVVFGLAALLLPPGTPRLVGLAIAVLAGDLAAASVVIVRLRKAIHPDRVADIRAVRSACFSCACMLPALGAGWFLVHAGSDDRFVRILIASVACVFAVAGFAFTLLIFFRRDNFESI